MGGRERLARLRTGLTTSCVEQGGGVGVPLVLLHAWGESRRPSPRSCPTCGPDRRRTHLAPTLVVSGAGDALLSRDETRRLVDAVPGSRWIEYPDAGHAVLWEQPERLARDVVAFADRLSRARSR